MSIELCQNITPVEKAEQLVGRPIVQLFPFVGVNVVHHQINIFLLKLVQRGALRNDASNEFMRDLNTALFVRAAWVTVEHKTAQVSIGILFDCGWIGELRPTVREDNGKELRKGVGAKCFIKAIDNISDRACGVGFPQKCQHEVRITEENRQQHLPAFLTLDRIHFHYRSIRIVSHELQEIGVCTALIAVLVQF